jgi:hypothetical protein
MMFAIYIYRVRSKHSYIGSSSVRIGLDINSHSHSLIISGRRIDLDASIHVRMHVNCWWWHFDLHLHLWTCHVQTHS